MKVMLKNDRYGFTKEKEYDVLDVVIENDSKFFLVNDDFGNKVHIFQSTFYVSKM